MSGKHLQIIGSLMHDLHFYSNETIEASVIEYISRSTHVPFAYNDELSIYQGKFDEDLISSFKSKGFPVNIEFITEFFESLLDKDTVVENGIVFTPEYIARFIFEEASKGNSFSTTPCILDPGCGCGIFLATAATVLHENTSLSFSEIFDNCIYGIELNEDNAKRCMIVLNLLPLLYGESNEGIKAHIICGDSLKCNWSVVFGVNLFDYIIGNPPYVNTHDMSKDTAAFLKQTFSTTRAGVFNIFYAFIEHAFQFLSPHGVLSYIVPNNFLTIKSATELRKLLQDNASIRLIIDFANNMVFKPVRTYNCIIQLTCETNQSFQYHVMENVEDIDARLQSIEYETMPIERLDCNGWKLIDRSTYQNIMRIEGQFKAIKEFIRTGIATLRDDVYCVDKDSAGYFKLVDGQRYNIEESIVKRLYKVPELKSNDNLQKICRYIIFPYVKTNNGFEIIREDVLQECYPGTYKYLLFQKPILDGRDKGKPNPVSWFAYGRTQGLNKYGIKLLFPTFANKPRFTLIDDEYALFCNGYAVFQNDFIGLDLLQRILNSTIMDYYIRNTSYAIEGGYYCYQKKYIERFSVPYFSKEEQAFLSQMTDEELDRYLIDLYELDY